MTQPDKLVEVLEKLHQRGALDVRLVERDETPLIWAVSEGYHDIAVTLIEAGAELNAQNVDGNTALLRAACEGRAAIGYHHIANFVVGKEQRGHSLSRLMLAKIVEKYARDYMLEHKLPIEHSQHLLCGRGFWQIGDPPWLERMERLGFHLRWGAESFFIEHDWAPLPAIRDRKTGEVISNVAYNRSFRLPERYLSGASRPGGNPVEHLSERVADVIRLSQDRRAKLQYFQTMFDFT